MLFSPPATKGEANQAFKHITGQVVARQTSASQSVTVKRAGDGETQKMVGDFYREILKQQPFDAENLAKKIINVKLETKKPAAEMKLSDYQMATDRAIFKQAGYALLTDEEIQTAVTGIKSHGSVNHGSDGLDKLRAIDKKPGAMFIPTDRATIEYAKRAGQAVLQYRQYQAKQADANQEKAKSEVNQMFADQGRVLWNSAVNTVEGTINTAIDAASTNGGTNPLPLLNPNRPQVDFSGAKSDYRSEMMRRDINGKLDGDGIKMGQAVETGVTVLAPLVIGKVFTPVEAPQSLKTLGGIPEATKALSIPQGLSEAQFAEFSQTIRESKAAEYGTDIRVHGSRAAGTAKEASDIDVAIRVPAEKFNQIVKQAFKNVKAGSGSSAERTMLHAIKTGKIQRGEIKLSGLGDLLKEKFGFKVDISVVKEGGTFDQGP